MAELKSLLNVGKVLEQELRLIGITTPEELAAVGSQEAFLRIRQHDPGACLSMLCGIEGAIEGVRWHQLPADKKAELKAFYDDLQGK